MKKEGKKTLSFDTKSINDEGVISGVLNYFGNKDHAGDVTLKGAFKNSIKSIQESGRELVMLWQHDPDKPIGVWKNLRETSRGLEGDGYINLDTVQGKEAYSLAKQGALSGLSIGYWVLDEEYDRPTKTNYLKEIELRETSLVTFPCNEQARIDEVKNLKLNPKGLPSVDDLKEHLLQGGLEEAVVDSICAKYMPDYTDPEEEARLKEAERVKNIEKVVALLEHGGLTVKDIADAIEASDPNVTTDEGTKEEEETEEVESKEGEEEPEEKSTSLDDFFSK
ncbi:HK97 family phage prohead protease [Vibrio fortis]|uniref:HK97 family phage prohead protease n=2 Tax=Vibrio fortis TaxID=212667 RepID=A0A5N3QVE7_9VIBR|nr:HK97 family phage prohead protease [Vibrio fortis]